MNEELALKLQAYADGEVSDREAREVADVLAQNADARTLLAELQSTRSALAGFETEIKLPESREFYWSKIEREIRRLEKAEPLRVEPSPFRAWRRFFVSAGALAAVAITGLLVVAQFRSPRAAEMESAFAGSDAFTYRDYAKGTTLVWLSYPAENEFTETDPEDILD
jgi:negative regulator of sigma E activity